MVIPHYGGGMREKAGKGVEECFDDDGRDLMK